MEGEDKMWKDGGGVRQQKGQSKEARCEGQLFSMELEGRTTVIYQY